MNTITDTRGSEVRSHSATLPAPTGPVVGVRTTRIYCRPICRPGRAPKPENCIPFVDAPAARSAGFRPCKQCRPDAIDPRPRAAETIRYGMGPTPVGIAFVALSDRGITALYALDEDDHAAGLDRLKADHPGALMVEDQAAVRNVLSRLVGALTGELDGSDEPPLDLNGTPFQLRVWDAIHAIPRGETRTYGDLARELGVPGAARAVGAACGTNPVWLLVPCHRVVGAGGGLGGYGGGLERKRTLLELERVGASSAPVA